MADVILQCTLSFVHKVYLLVNSTTFDKSPLLHPVKVLRDQSSGNKPLMVACPFVSEDLEAVQDGLSLPDSNRVHLFYLESQTLIRVQDLILSEK